jgi:hypothetical protein
MDTQASPKCQDRANPYTKDPPAKLSAGTRATSQTYSSRNIIHGHSEMLKIGRGASK